MPGWHVDFRPYQHFKVEAVGDARGIRVTGADMCSVCADVAVQEKQTFLLNFEFAYQVSPDNRTQLTLSWYGEDGRVLESAFPLQLPNGESAGSSRLQLPMCAPEGAARLRVRFRASRQSPGDFLELHRWPCLRWRTGRRVNDAPTRHHARRSSAPCDSMD